MSNERSAWFTVKFQVLTLSSYNMHLLWKHFGVKHYVAQVNRNESAHMKINRLSEKEKKKKKGCHQIYATDPKTTLLNLGYSYKHCQKISSKNWSSKSLAGT